MNDSDIWFKLAIAGLATWRVTHLLAREEGPFLLLARLRAMAGRHWWGEMFDCFYCLSLWVAAPMAVWVGASWLQWAMTWLALSGIACLCERIGQPALAIQPFPVGQTEDIHHRDTGDQHELLRTTS